jgi:hypothetical protein
MTDPRHPKDNPVGAVPGEVLSHRVDIPTRRRSVTPLSARQRSAAAGAGMGNP